MTADIYTVLQTLGIAYERYDHDAVFTCDDAERAVPDAGAVHTKNLFVRDKRGRRHLLVITTCAKSADLKRLADLVDADNLSFASAERLERYLGVSKGAVTILGLVNDTAHAVELVIDADVWRAPRIHAHPLVNTATLVLSHEDVERFLKHTGHPARVVEW